MSLATMAARAFGVVKAMERKVEEAKHGDVYPSMAAFKTWFYAATSWSFRRQCQSITFKQTCAGSHLDSLLNWRLVFYPEVVLKISDKMEISIMGTGLHGMSRQVYAFYTPDRTHQFHLHRAEKWWAKYALFETMLLADIHEIRDYVEAGPYGL